MILKRLTVLDRIEEAWIDCQRCPLARCRTRLVHWRGNPEAPLFVIGEAPGETEDLVGRPFVGRAGRLLDQALVTAGLDPNEDVFIVNQVACRPPGNRAPEREEIKACSMRLHQFLRVVRPRALLLLGRTAARLAGAYSVTSERGTPIEVELLFYNGAVQLYEAVITYHPSYVLRTGGPGADTFQSLVSDIKACRKIAKN